MSKSLIRFLQRQVIVQHVTEVWLKDDDLMLKSGEFQTKWEFDVWVTQVKLQGQSLENEAYCGLKDWNNNSLRVFELWQPNEASHFPQTTIGGPDLAVGATNGWLTVYIQHHLLDQEISQWSALTRRNMLSWRLGAADKVEVMPLAKVTVDRTHRGMSGKQQTTH